MLKGINYESNSEKGSIRGCGEKEPSYTVVRNINWCTHYGEQYGGSLKKTETKIRAAIWSISLTPGHMSRKDGTLIQKRPLDPSVHSNIVYNVWHMEATLIPINRWMDKEDMIPIYSGILLSHKYDAICSNMDRPRDYHTKWSKSVGERQLSSNIFL